MVLFLRRYPTRPRVATTPAKAATATIVFKAMCPAVLYPLESTTSGEETDIVLRSYFNQRQKVKP